MARPGSDFTPGGADFLEQLPGFVEGRLVVVEIGAQEAPRDVFVKGCQPLRQFAAALYVERRQQAVVDDVERARNGFALARGVPGLHMHARRPDSDPRAFEQHVDQLMRRGRQDGALHSNAGVGASTDSGTHREYSWPAACVIWRRWTACPACRTAG